MSNKASASKRSKQDQKKRKINAQLKSRVKTFVNKVKSFIEAKDQDGANKALSLANSAMGKAQKKGVLKRNTVARKMRRLNAKIKFISIAQPTN